MVILNMKLNIVGANPMTPAITWLRRFEARR